jgi:hypothetical protein
MSREKESHIVELREANRQQVSGTLLGLLLHFTSQSYARVRIPADPLTPWHNRRAGIIPF